MPADKKRKSFNDKGRLLGSDLARLRQTIKQEIARSSTGGSGVFVSKSVSGYLQIASGNSGDIITITPPSGQRVRLNGLGTTTGQEALLSITVGSTTVVNSLKLGNHAGTAVGQFVISNTSDGSASSLLAGAVVPPIVGETDEVITVIKDTGNTTQTIGYNYEYGV